jgi:Bax protein
MTPFSNFFKVFERMSFSYKALFLSLFSLFPISYTLQHASQLSIMSLYPGASSSSSEGRIINNTLKEKNFFAAGSLQEAMWNLQHPLVPQRFLERLPRELPTLKCTKTRKSAFICALLPLILKANQAILQERAILLNCVKTLAKQGSLTPDQESWVQDLMTKYRVTPGKNQYKDLLKKVDVIPPSLALAQAIVESGFGTSRAAQHQNSTFGHMVTPTRIASFVNLQENVSTYMLNLNRHRAYKEFHAIRHSLRTANKDLSSTELLKGLIHYCERKEAYLEQVQDIITKNKLNLFDTFKLQEV